MELVQESRTQKNSCFYLTSALSHGTSNNNRRKWTDLINPTTNWISVWKTVYWNNTRPTSHQLPRARHRLLIQPPLHQTADGLFVLSAFSPKVLWAFSGSASPAQLCRPSALHLSLGSTSCRPDPPAPAPGSPPRTGGAAHQPSCPVPLTRPCSSLPRSPLCIWINFPEGEWTWHQVRWVFVVFPAADEHFTLLISCNQISFVMNKSRATITRPCNLSNLLF